MPGGRGIGCGCRRSPDAGGSQGRGRPRSQPRGHSPAYASHPPHPRHAPSAGTGKKKAARRRISCRRSAWRLTPPDRSRRGRPRRYTTACRADVRTDGTARATSLPAWGVAGLDSRLPDGHARHTPTNLPPHSAPPARPERCTRVFLTSTNRRGTHTPVLHNVTLWPNVSRMHVSRPSKLSTALPTHWYRCHSDKSVPLGLAAGGARSGPGRNADPDRAYEDPSRILPEERGRPYVRSRSCPQRAA